MSAAQLLSAAGVRQLTRSASGVVAKAARGFQVFRIDGYSWTKNLPGGERISSQAFAVGGRNWFINYFPNGSDSSKDDSDSISLYLQIVGGYQRERVRAQYKFSLLDVAGNPAFELPAETAIFTSPGGGRHHYGGHGEGTEAGSMLGHADFIGMEELERRRESLLKDDCLAVRCDVGVIEVGTMAVAPKDNYNAKQEDDDDSDCDDGAPRESRRRRQPMDDREYVRRCLAKSRRA